MREKQQRIISMSSKQTFSRASYRMVVAPTGKAALQQGSEVLATRLERRLFGWTLGYSPFGFVPHPLARMARGTEKYNWVSGMVVASGQTIGIVNGGRGKGSGRFGRTALHPMVHSMLGLQHKVTWLRKLMPSPMTCVCSGGVNG